VAPDTFISHRMFVTVIAYGSTNGCNRTASDGGPKFVAGAPLSYEKKPPFFAVTMDLLLIPNERPFDPDRITVPLVAVCEPAATARLFADAVMMDDPLIPNETLFELEKTSFTGSTVDCVPAEYEPGPTTEAVTVELAGPKETPLPLENVSADRLFEVVPAETLMF